jgi:magnesium chelatase subunit I
LDDATDEEYERILGSIVPLEILVKNTQLEKEDKFFMKEFILWAMVEYKN